MARVKEAGQVLVEQHEHYGKQSYRNRCEIMTANGPAALVVPVCKAAAGERLLTRDARVDYSTRWQKVHERSIEAAYGNSPFHDYYMDEFYPFFYRREKFLVDLNGKIMERLMACLEIRRHVSLTVDYLQRLPDGIADFRDVIHPKASRRARVDDYSFVEYHQTFTGRFPFTPGLSALDLLCNAGPDALAYL
jgi:hypothetical protein